MARVIRFILAGAIGAFIGWLIVEPIPSLTPVGDVAVSLGALAALGFIIGVCIGFALAIAEFLSGMAIKDAGRSIGMGALIGGAGGMLGLAFGQMFYSPLAAIGHSKSVPIFASFILLLIGRSIGWALIGAFIGLTQGIVFGVPKRMINGAVGGLIGGGIGGAAFEIMAQMNRGGALAFPPEMLRLVGFAASGAGIGLFIGLFEELFKQAWVKVLRGKNEGREFILYKPSSILGRDELADVPVFGDTSIAQQHAEIRLENNHYTVYDLGSPFGTSVNGTRITSQQLRDGDMIQVGTVNITFHEKASASRIAPYIDRPPVQQAQIPRSDHVCQFCGRIKDANGNCDCTVGASQPVATQDPFAQATQQVPQQNPFGTNMPTQQPTYVKPTPAGSGSANLVGISGAYAGHTFTLGQEPVPIGRDATKRIALSMDSTVSRNHAHIALEGGVFVLYDDGSSNGTYLNNAKVQRQPLKNGDVIQIGSNQFRFEE